MRGFWPIFKRELFSLFVTPLAWVLLTAFLLVQGLHFFLIVTHFANQADLAVDAGPVQSFFGQTILPYLPLLLICPLLTMRLFAEERRSGTIEALLTAPVGTTGVVLAKYMAALVTYVIMWAPTLLYLVLIQQTGEVDWRVVAASYLGVTLVGAGYLAIGTMTSAMTQSQVLAAVLSAMALVALFMLGIGEFIFTDGPLNALCAHVSVWTQMNDFSRGIVDLRRITFDATLILVPLFVAVRAVDAWRWG
ncbi:ABC transporter permease [Chondromyces apiculatus]|uniref:Gliding motility protein GldF n=1 Tax=Chondromyces apiculatus DSM 436 TaxID=1192034 RepID=A0A017SZ38_9BACT|nr:ABC transporter permease [Chondromyces apiculatus]EYF02022.1 gliding motility protein GldF [Chondromyces apiculatus DSM 436]